MGIHFIVRIFCMWSKVNIIRFHYLGWKSVALPRGAVRLLPHSSNSQLGLGGDAQVGCVAIIPRGAVQVLPQHVIYKHNKSILDKLRNVAFFGTLEI